MKKRLKLTTTALAIAVLCGCGTEDSASAGGDEQDASGAPSKPTSVFGKGCKKNADCPDGLMCMQSEYSPTAFCTKFCETDQDYCDGAELGGAKALCIAMPGVWNGPTRQVCEPKCEKRGRPFCVPTCQNTAECKSTWGSWEKCTKPAYKNVALYNALPTKVCMAPSSHGQPVIDPRTCAWESKITDPAVVEAKQLCKAHCDFLTKCQLFDPKVEATSCCTWRCFQKMAPEGAIDQQRKAHIKCILKAFGAARTTQKVCQFYKEQCDPLEYPRG